jgi:large subunit ribosomal protein L24
MLRRIKKDDSVMVMSGRDKGKQGQVIKIDSRKRRVLIKDVCVVTRHIKARRSGEQSRIAKEETFIDLCKVMPVCPSCKKACRIQVKSLEEGEMVRVCHRCKEAF